MSEVKKTLLIEYVIDENNNVKFDLKTSAPETTEVLKVLNIVFNTVLHQRPKVSNIVKPNFKINS